MSSSEPFRAKAAEFRELLAQAPHSPNEASELRDLERTYTTLAENEEWMAAHIDQTIQPIKNGESRTALAEEEDEQILKCLGAAVLMRWNTVPTKLQRELFDCACAVGDLQQATPLKGAIARFLMIIRMTSRNRISGEAAAAGKWCRKSDSKTTAQAEREPPGRASVYVS